MTRYEKKSQVWHDASRGSEIRGEWEEVWVPISMDEIKEWYNDFYDREYTDFDGFIEFQILGEELRIVE